MLICTSLTNTRPYSADAACANVPHSRVSIRRTATARRSLLKIRFISSSFFQKAFPGTSFLFYYTTIRILFQYFFSKRKVAGRCPALTVDKAVKVFARLFQKAAQSRARSPRRRPQTAKSPFRRFLFAKLFLCAYMVKEKAPSSFALFWMITPFSYSHRGLLERSPLRTRKNFPPKGRTLWFSVFFERL